MNEEIKTEDIIKSLRICAQGNPDACAACAYYGIATCYEELCEDAADRLERLSNQHIKIQYNNEELTISEMCSRMDELRKKANAARLENELLRGALKSSGHEELRDTELMLETLRMAARALESKPHWIPCVQQLPEMHEEVDYIGRCEESDLVLVCDAGELHPQVHVGRCSRIGDKVWWMTREWKVLDKVTAWMPLPEVYSEED